MNYKVVSIILWSLLLILTVGCSGGSAITPDVSGDGSITAEMSRDISHHVWSVWEIRIDAVSETAEIVPLRGPSFTANVNSLLESKPGNLLIEDMDVTQYMSSGRLDCTITLKHPFPGLDMYHGFDVWGVFLNDGTDNFHYEGLTYAGGDDPHTGWLLNPDGYTRWYNYAEFSNSPIPILGYTPGKLGNLEEPSAKVCPYKVFADGLDDEEDYYSWLTTPGNMDDRGVFRAGSVNSRRYEIQFPFVGGIPSATFQYAVVATWEPGDPELTGLPNVYDIEDFPTSANCEEPFFVKVDSSASTLYNDGAGSSGGTFIADIEIFDWQGGYGGNGILNEINIIQIEGDFIEGGYEEITKTQLEPTAVPGTENSSVFQVEIVACDPPECGTYDAWILIEADGLNGSTYEQGFGISVPDTSRTPFMSFTVEVSCEPAYMAVFVDDSNTTGVEDGTMAHPYNTIQEGIDASTLLDDYEVWVDDSGNPYVEYVEMASDVVLKSVNWDTSDGSNRAVIDGGDDADTWSVSFVDCENAWIEGFEITFAGENDPSPLPGSRMLQVDGGNNNTVIDCYFEGLTDSYLASAIYAVHTDDLTISNCRFSDIDKKTLDTGCTYFYIIDVDVCPGIMIKNNVFTDIRSSSDGIGKYFSMIRIEGTNGITVKNNLLHHVVLHAPNDVLMGYMAYFDGCSNITTLNNTVDYIDITDAFFIQQVFCFWYQACSDVDFTNNIITRVYSNGFPPVLGRGVDSHDGDIVTLDYTDIYDTVLAYNGDVVEGTGYIEVDPGYIDPDNGEYDVGPSSLCQNGDPDILDWDDGGSGGSRMGCYGGPGGEFVGLLTSQ